MKDWKANLLMILLIPSLTILILFVIPELFTPNTRLFPYPKLGKKKDRYVEHCNTPIKNATFASYKIPLYPNCEEERNADVDLFLYNFIKEKKSSYGFFNYVSVDTAESLMKKFANDPNINVCYYDRDSDEGETEISLHAAYLGTDEEFKEKTDSILDNNTKVKLAEELFPDSERKYSKLNRTERLKLPVAVVRVKSNSTTLAKLNVYCAGYTTFVKDPVFEKALEELRKYQSKNFSTEWKCEINYRVQHAVNGVWEKEITTNSSEKAKEAYKNCVEKYGKKHCLVDIPPRICTRSK